MHVSVKAEAPYEFGFKVSIAKPVAQPKGSELVLHAKRDAWQPPIRLAKAVRNDKG